MQASFNFTQKKVSSIHKGTYSHIHFLNLYLTLLSVSPMKKNLINFEYTNFAKYFAKNNFYKYAINNSKPILLQI